MFRPAARFLACASLLALCACASASPDGTAASTVAAPQSGLSDGLAYGQYLAGRAALNGGDNTGASAYFAQAARSSGSEDVREEAFFAAILSGDMDRAVALAPPPTGSAAALTLSRLVLAVNDMANGKNRQALAAMNGDPIGYPHRAAAALLKPWVAAAAGDMAAATAEPDGKADRLSLTLANLGRVQLLEQARRYDDAEAALKAQIEQESSGSLFSEAYGQFLERRGRYDQAVALYDGILAKTPGNFGVQQARARAALHKPAPSLPPLKVGAAQALLGASASALMAKQVSLSLVYLRLSLRLDPKSDDGWMTLGDMMAASEDYEAARTAYDHVVFGSNYFPDARVRIIGTYQAAGDQTEALRLARDTVAKSPDSNLARTTLADVLRANKQYAESAQVMDAVIGGETRPTDWRLYYLRAMALDKAGRWSDAERDLKAGLELNPDEAELLNYLGYAWIERGERLEEALAMVQKAVAAEPESGVIIDSLGWAYFQLGQYAKAVEQLEKASQLEPADPDINTHLGDAYWRTGRRIEAQFQWSKALNVMKPDAKLKAALERRLQSGLEAPAPSAKVAKR